MGLPDETIEQRNETLRLALKIKLNVPLIRITACIFIFLKGSELFQGFKHLYLNGGVEFCESNNSPLLTNLEEERRLIKGYPHIFPSFFRLKSGEDPHYLRKEALLFDVIIDFFPITVSLMLKEKSIEPHELGGSVIKFMDKKGFDWQVPREGSEYYNYLVLFEAYVRSDAADIIKQACSHETLIREAGLFNTIEERANEIKLRSKLKKSKSVIIRNYDYDIPEIIETLKAGTLLNREKKPSVLSYAKVGGVVNAVPLDALDNALLQLCNGKRSVREIINVCLDEESRTKRAKDLLFEKFVQLNRQGVLKV